MAPSFISTTELGSYLRRDVSAEELATIATDAACAVVRTYTRQTLTATDGDTVSYVLRGTASSLLLPGLPVLAIDEVRIDDEVTLDWRVEENGIVSLTDLPSSSAERIVEVDYSHGYDPVPDDLRLVALTVAARIYEQGTARQESTGSSSITFSVAASTDLSSGEKAIVEKYRVIRPSPLVATAAAPEGPLTDEVQQVVENITGDNPAGTYTVTIGGETTTPLTFNGTNQERVDAYAALPSVELGVNLIVNGGGTHTLTFTGDWGGIDQPLVTITDIDLVDAEVAAFVITEGGQVGD
jgi:hypothetical protein